MTKWKKDDVIQCRLGLYNERTSVDWLLINITVEADKPKFTCSDGHSKFSSINTVKEDSMINCFLNLTHSKMTKDKDGKAKFEAHFIRNFVSDDTNEDEDIALRTGNNYGA